MSEERRLTIDGVEIHDGGPCYVIAEIGHNHQGSLETGEGARSQPPRNAVPTRSSCRSATTARSSRASSTSSRTTTRTASARRTVSTARRWSFGRDDYAELQAHARELGITFFATAFDFASADFLAELDVPAFKIASGDLRNTPLLRHVAALRQADDPLHRRRRRWRTSTARSRRSCRSTRSSASCSAPPPIPPTSEELNLRVITDASASASRSLVVGLSDHENGIAMALVAYMLGARVIEKHFTLNHAVKGTDHAFSLMPEGMRKLVRDLQRAPGALGDGVKRSLPERGGADSEDGQEARRRARAAGRARARARTTWRSSRRPTAACRRTSSTGSSAGGCGDGSRSTSSSRSTTSSLSRSTQERTRPRSRDGAPAAAGAGAPGRLRLRRCLHRQPSLGQRARRGSGRVLAQRRARVCADSTTSGCAV